MAELKDLYQSADWKKEKHAPVIEAPETVKKGRSRAGGGERREAGRASEHHRASHPLDRGVLPPGGAKFPFQVARFDFTAHGESPEGPDTSTVYANPSVLCSLKTERPGTIMASSYCNVHGLWESARKISLA